MSDPQRRCPYQGLDPFDEKDVDFFFGREKETRLIIANLFASPLMILYGASGVGKSSVLRAGVAYQLHQRDDILVVVFGTWQGNPVNDLKTAISKESSRAASEIEPPSNSLPLAEYLSAWEQKLNRRIMVILDQFEEYFLYHPQGDTFAEEFPKAVTQRDVPISFLISIREDSIFKLDLFKGRIPTLFDNYLRLEHLDCQAATAAIVEPVKTYYRLQGDAEIENHIDPALVDAVIEQVQTGTVLIGEVGHGQIAMPTRDVQVETPYLQIVMTRLWDEEMRAGSRVLRKETLLRLGGTEHIVRTHLDTAMCALSSVEQDMAADAFFYLVTPSGTKVAHTISDLAEYSHLQQTHLSPLLEKLAAGNTRILRAFTRPNQPYILNYEIFHDVLASAILDWRLRYVQAKERAKSEKSEKELAKLIVTQWILGLVALVVLGVNIPFLSVYTSDILLAPRAVNQQVELKDLGANAIVRYDPILRANSTTPSQISVEVEYTRPATPMTVTFRKDAAPDIVFEGTAQRDLKPPASQEKFSIILYQSGLGAIPYNPFSPRTEHRQVELVFAPQEQTSPVQSVQLDFRVDNYSGFVVCTLISMVSLLIVLVAFVPNWRRVRRLSVVVVLTQIFQDWSAEIVRRRQQSWTPLVLAFVALGVLLLSIPFLYIYTTNIVLAPNSVNMPLALSDMGAQAIIRYDPVLRTNSTEPSRIQVEIEYSQSGSPIVMKFRQDVSPDILLEGTPLRELKPPASQETYLIILNQSGWGAIPYNLFNPHIEHRQVELVFTPQGQESPVQSVQLDFRVDSYSVFLISVALSIAALATFVVGLFGNIQKTRESLDMLIRSRRQ